MVLFCDSMPLLLHSHAESFLFVNTIHTRIAVGVASDALGRYLERRLRILLHLRAEAFLYYNKKRSGIAEKNQARLWDDTWGDKCEC